MDHILISSRWRLSPSRGGKLPIERNDYAAGAERRYSTLSPSFWQGSRIREEIASGYCTSFNVLNDLVLALDLH